MKRKITVKRVAAMLTEMIIDGVKDLPKPEQERRIEAFCRDAEKGLRKPAELSGRAARS